MRRALIVWATLALAACGGEVAKKPAPSVTLPTVTAVDVGAGVFDVVLKPVTAGGEPLRGLQVALQYDASAFTVDRVEAGSAAGRMDTVFDDHGRQAGTLVAGVTDLRQVALPISGSALRVHYLVQTPGPTSVQVVSALGVDKDAKSITLPTGSAQITVR